MLSIRIIIATIFKLFSIKIGLTKLSISSEKYPYLDIQNMCSFEYLFWLTIADVNAAEAAWVREEKSRKSIILVSVKTLHRQMAYEAPIVSNLISLKYKYLSFHYTRSAFPWTGRIIVDYLSMMSPWQRYYNALLRVTNLCIRDICFASPFVEAWWNSTNCRLSCRL